MAAILAAIASAIITFLIFLTINFVKGNREGQYDVDDEVVTETGPQKLLPWKRSQYDYQGKAESVEAFIQRGTFDELFKFMLRLYRAKRRINKSNWAATQHLRGLSLKAGLSLKLGDPANFRSITIGYIGKFLKFDPETSIYPYKGIKEAPPPGPMANEPEINKRVRKPGSGITIDGVPYHETEEYKATQNPQPAPPPMRDILSSADTSHWVQQPPPPDNRPPLFQFNDSIPRFHNQPNEPINFEYVGKTQNDPNYPFGPPLPPMTSII